MAGCIRACDAQHGEERETKIFCDSIDHIFLRRPLKTVRGVAVKGVARRGLENERCFFPSKPKPDDDAEMEKREVFVSDFGT